MTNAQQVQIVARDVSNVHGELIQTGNGPLQLQLTGTLDNTSGKLASNGRDLEITAQGVDNTDGVIEHAGSGALTIGADVLTNTRGSIASNGQGTLTLGKFDNRNGTLGSTGALTVVASASLDNRSGSIAGKGAVAVSAHSIANSGGRMAAEGALDLRSALGLDNSAGSITAVGKVELGANGFDNSNGLLGSAQGSVTADAGSGALDNNGGRLEAATSLVLAGHGLSNANGVVVGRDVAIDSRNASLDNAGGLLTADGTLDVKSGTLNNDAGLIQSAGAMRVDTHGQTLANTNSGGDGGIRGQGAVTLAAGSFDNRGGYLGGAGPVAITANGLDNRGGDIEALTTLAAAVAGTLANGAPVGASGLIRAGQTIDLTAAQIDNSGTRAAGRGVQADSVALTAHRIDNAAGTILANHALTLTSGGTIDNTAGLLSSTDSMTVRDPSASPLANIAGKTLALTNAGGTLVADRQLNLDAASLAGAGSVESGEDLSVKLSAGLIHTGKITADRNATLDVAGTLRNAGQLAAGAMLTVRAGTLDNQAAGAIAAPTLEIKATDPHTLINRGLIDGVDTFLDAVTLDNLGTGRIYGTHVGIAAATLNNLAEGGVAPVIAARNAGRVDIGAGSINNRDGALVFSTGDLAIGGALDADHRATGSSNTLSNHGATIEAIGQVAIAATNINNTNAGLTLTQTTDPAVAYDQFTPAGTAYLYNTADYPEAEIGNFNISWRWAGNSRFREYWRYVYTGTTTRDAVATTRPGQILSGRDMSLSGNVTNSDSRIIAGQSLTLTGGSVSNLNTQGQATTSYAGTTYYYDYDGNESCSDPGDGCYDISAYAYDSAPNVSTYSLGAAHMAANTAAGTGTSVAGRAAVSSAADASGAGSASLAAGQAVARLVQVGGVTGPGGVPMVVRTLTPSIVLPASSLYRTNPGQSGRPLVETDPAFANYRTWLSSDAMLRALSLDPATTQKRLGDGFYEQRLINEQVAQLTGRRFLANYTSDEAQYQALIDAGVTVARAMNLVPGVALSAEQMAALTSDIVWLVEKALTLPDGSTQKVLVPQVYVRVRDGDLAPSGALLAGNSIDFKLSGDLTNSGTIAGRQVVALSAENIRNLGRITGRDLAVQAAHDLTVLGGSLEAETTLIASAGHDLSVESTTRSQTGARSQRTHLDRLAGLYVTGDAQTGQGGTLIAAAGNDLSLRGAVLVNTVPAATSIPAGAAAAPGATLLSAGRDLSLGTVAESEQQAHGTGKRWISFAERSERGSTLVTDGDLSLAAGRDLSAKAASATSGGALTATAGRDLTVTAGEAAFASESYSKSKKSGFLSSKTSERRNSVESTSALASTFSGETTSLQAGQDIRVTGSNVSASGDTALMAGRDIVIESAQETHKEMHFRAEKKSGFSVSSLGGISYGKSAMKQNSDGESVTQVASTVSGANVSAVSGRDTTVSASNVLADDSIAILAGRNVDILAAANTQNISSQTKSSSTSIGLASDLFGRKTIFGKTKDSLDETGSAVSQSTSLLSANKGDLTIRAGLDAQHKGTGQGNLTTQGADLLAAEAIALSGNAIDLQAVANASESHSLAKSKSFTIGARPAGFIGEKIAAMGDAIERAQSSDNERLKGALVLKAGYDGWKMSQGQPPIKTVPAGTETTPGSGTAGASSSEASSGFGVQVYVGSSKSKSESRTHEQTVTGTNLQARSIDITATETDIKMAAAKLQAETIRLDAARDVLLEAAANTATLASNNKGSSMGFGVTLAFGGQQSGLSFQISASQAKGKMTGAETVWDNTLISASDSLSVRSGRDSTLRGAQLTGDRVLFDVGGNLLIETLQDSSQYASKQTSSGFNLSICWFYCVGTPVTGSIGSSSQSIKHNYLSAVGQSGIAAGEGGFDIKVRGNTDLVGAAITSTAAADKNRLTTASLTSRDLDNAQNTKASASSMSLAYGGGSAMATMAGNATANLLNNLNGNAALPKNQSEKSRTLSVISPATITITGSGNAAQDAQSRQAATELTSRDPKTANAALKNTLTLQQAGVLERDIVRQKENQEAAQLVGAVLSNVVGDLAKSMRQPVEDAKLRRELDERQAGGQALSAHDLKELARLDAAGVTSEKARETLADPAALATHKNWEEGSAAKIALHGMVGLIEAKVGNGSAAAGALGAMTQEALVPLLSDYLLAQGISGEDYKSLMQLGTTLAGTAVGALAGGTKGAAGGATAAFVGVTNNYLKHDEALRMAALKEKKLKGQCDTACQQDISALEKVDQERNVQLSDCQGVSSLSCNNARQEVRNAAAEYLRKETFALNSGSGFLTLDNAYATEKSETLNYAQGTLDGKATGTAAGVGNAAVSMVVDTAKALYKLTGTLGNAALGDSQAQHALQAGASNAWDYVKNPDNWPYLLGTMTPEQREQLAQAYEKADGYTVGRIMGEQVLGLLSNMPSGGVAGSVRLVKAGERAADTASILARMEKRSPQWLDGFARAATKNADSNKVVFGKFLEDEQSYTKVAAHYEATYFKLDNWRDLSKAMSVDELWKINEAFIDQQIRAGKEILLSHDPGKATGFYKRELTYLSELGYKFMQDGWVWRAVR